MSETVIVLLNVITNFLARLLNLLSTTVLKQVKLHNEKKVSTVIFLYK